MSNTMDFLLATTHKDWPAVYALQQKLALPPGARLMQRYDGTSAEIYAGPFGDPVVPVDLYEATAELYREVIDITDADAPLNPDGSRVVVATIPNGVLASGDEQAIHDVFYHLTLALLRATPRMVSRATIVEFGASKDAAYSGSDGVLRYAFQRNETVLRLCVKVQ